MDDTSPTMLLKSSLAGDADAAREFFPVVYGELHALAERLMRDQRPDQTLQPTALIHEVWFRLIEPTARGEFQNRQHFLRIAATAMRNLLVDRARRRRAEKRGGGRARVELEELPLASRDVDDQVVAVDEVMAKLTAEDPELARLVELRFFGGLSIEATAEVLEVSVPTVVRQWRVARTWLARELSAAN